MTKSEIKEKAKIKKILQAKGLLPPDKKRLNRKRFIDEAREQWEKRDLSCILWDYYIQQALVWMTSYTDMNLRPSQQAVGAAKVYKIALKLKEFEEEKRELGETKYKFKEVYERLKDIMEA